MLYLSYFLKYEEEIPFRYVSGSIQGELVSKTGMNDSGTFPFLEYMGFIVHKLPM